MTTVKNISTSLHLRVSKTREATKQHIYELLHETKSSKVLDKLVPGSPFTGQNVAPF